MKVYAFTPGDRTLPAHPRAVALGLFDGVHAGHRAVICRAVGRDAPNGSLVPLPACVAAFRQPAWQIKPDAAQICSDEARDRALQTLGVEERIDLDFDAVRDLSPEAFVRQVLLRDLRAAFVCCGENYHFGRGGAGTAETLRSLCAEAGIPCEIVPTLPADGEAISSSRIRRCIAAGDMRTASRLLGRPFTIDFPVTDGQHRGRTFGFPTINQPLPPHFVQPRFGVYASCAIVDGKMYRAVTNIGRHPSVGCSEPTAETYIYGYSGDLYGQRIPVTPVRFLRPERVFDGAGPLRDQILRDSRQALALTQPDGSAVRAVLFDFDDTLQDFNASFPRYADWFVRRRFPDLDAAEHAARVRFMCAHSNHGYIPWPDYLEQMIREWNWTSPPPPDELLKEFCLKTAEVLCMRPDAFPLLQTLRQRGYLIGLVTNGPAVMQHRKLDLCRLRPLLDTVAVSGTEGVHKPEPELFRRAAMRLGVACENCLYVGDHPVNDIGGAQAAGMQAAFLPTSWDFEPQGNYLTISRLSDLLALLPPRKEL
ncbi:MAG: HAD-IA family hydrolase [Clostridia bacterium]|nr:HAD-IA family hydrolase [Clostridia bacterium]